MPRPADSVPLVVPLVRLPVTRAEKERAMASPLVRLAREHLLRSGMTEREVEESSTLVVTTPST